MADDDKGAKPETPPTVGHPAAAEMTGAGHTPQSEWTASDRRGPLDAAADEGVERVVPAHEMDAEGGVDHAPPVTETETVVDPPRVHEVASHEHTETVGEAAAPSSTSSEGRHIGSDALSSAVEPERKRSLIPVAAGLVIGALVGAGSAWLVYSQGTGAGADGQQVAALTSRLDALEKRPDPQADIAKLQTGLGDVRGKVEAMAKPSATAAASQDGVSRDGLAGKVAALQAAVDELKTRAPARDQAGAAKSPAQAPAADAGLSGKVAALQTALDDVKTRTAALQAQEDKSKGDADKVATLQGSLTAAQKQTADTQSGLDAVKGEQKHLGDRIADLTVAVAGALKVANGAQKDASSAQTGVETVQGQQKVLEGKLGSPALAVVADSLVQQIDAGQPYSRQVEALAALSADPARIAVLRENAARGVPSAQALLARWKPLADPVIATGGKAPADANFGQRLQHGLFGLVSVRREDGTTGNDLASRVNLIEADLAHDDVPGAFAAWQALPADAKAKSDSWGALAKTSVEALSAARDLQHSAIDALGAKKS